MIMIGVSAIKVEAMPASVYYTAMSEKETPRKGPKIVPPVAAVIAFLSGRERKSSFPLRE